MKKRVLKMLSELKNNSEVYINGFFVKKAGKNVIVEDSNEVVKLSINEFINDKLCLQKQHILGV